MPVTGKRRVGVAFGLMLVGLGAMWMARGNGWIGAAPPSIGLAIVGSIVAGLGVALVFVTIRAPK